VDVSVLGSVETVTSLCLVDTGSLHNRFGRWIADLAGIDLAGVEEHPIGIGGVVVRA
jgi:hypothetical protein